MPQTKGEYRVGINFNPSADDTVGRIKSMASALIDFIDGIPADRTTVEGNERGRLKALAQTAVEEAAKRAYDGVEKVNHRAALGLDDLHRHGGDLFSAAGELANKAESLLARLAATGIPVPGTDLRVRDGNGSGPSNGKLADMAAVQHATMDNLARAHAALDMLIDIL